VPVERLILSQLFEGFTEWTNVVPITSSTVIRSLMVSLPAAIELWKSHEKPHVRFVGVLTRRGGAVSPPRRTQICHGPIVTHPRRFERLPVALPALFSYQAAAACAPCCCRPLPYAAVNVMRCPDSYHLPKWSRAPPVVRWLSFFYLQRGMSHNCLGCTVRLSVRVGWD